MNFAQEIFLRLFLSQFFCLIPSNEIFNSDTVVFISRNSLLVFFISSMSKLYSNMWNTVVITILFSFSNSNICVCSGWVSTDTLFIMGHIFLFLASACLIIFGWMPDIVSFSLLGAEYFCIPVNV